MIYEKQAGVPRFESNEYREKTKDYVVLIPIINEGERIIKELKRAFRYGVADHADIVICDGGSTDGCTEEDRLKKLRVNTLLVKQDAGKQGAQLRMGIWWSLERGYRGVITIDGNNKDSIEDVPRFIEQLKKGYDYVQGSRFLEGGRAVRTPFVRTVSVRLLHAPVISLTAHHRFTDTTNAFRAYSADYLRDERVQPLRDIFMTYELLAYLSVRATQIGRRACEIPVTRAYPKGGRVPTKISFLKGNSELMKILLLNAAGAYAPKEEEGRDTDNDTIILKQGRKRFMNGKTQQQAKEEILNLVKDYCDTYHNVKKPFAEGQRIPYASRVYDSAEMVNLVDSALEFWLTAGRYTDEFEKKLAEYLGVTFCSLVNSGSSANLLAFMALTSPLLGDRAIGRGDEVITVAAGFPTTVAPLIQYGAVPVFVDVTIPQYNIDVTMLEEALSERTKAVMIAHTLGNPFDLQAVSAFCKKHNLWLVEDNCDALGSEYCIDGAWKLTGTVGDIGTSSFYPPHHMTMGEGGAVYTNNPLLHKCIRSFRDWGRDCVCPSGRDNLCGHRFDRQYGELPPGYDHKYVYSHFGYNLKATDMQAAVGCAQLEKFPSFVERRRHNFDRLKAALLADQTVRIEDKLILPEACEHSNPSWFGFMVTCKDGTSRNQVVRYMEDHGVQTRMLFAGNLTKHPCFDEMRATGKGYRIVGELANTDRIMEDTFWIGVYPGMTDEMIDYMARTLGCAVTQ